METIGKQPKASFEPALLIIQATNTVDRVFFTLISCEIWLIELLISFQRYAFTPLMDDSDDEEIEEFLANSNFGMITLEENGIPNPN